MNSQAAAEKYARGFFNAFQAYRRNHGGGATIAVQPQVEPKPTPVVAKEPAPVVEKNSKAERKKAKEEKKAREKKLKEEKKAQEEKKAAADTILTIAPPPVVPEPQREVKPELQLEVKPEPMREVKPEPQPEVKPEVKPEVESEAKLEAKSEVKPAAKPEVKPEQQPVAQPSAPQPQPQPQGPVFKVQIFASSALVKAGDVRFKGLSDTGYYKDGGLYKYTVGDSTDYNAINRLRREISDKFPQAFIVAFKDGVRMDVNEAIREFKQLKK